MSGRAFPVAAGALGIAVALLIVYPLAAMLPEVFIDGGELELGAFVDAWKEPGALRALLNTLVVVGASTAIAVVVGAGFAWLNERTDARLGWVIEALPVVPMMVPPLAGTIGWILLLSPGPGFINVVVRDLFGGGDEGPLTIFSWYGLIFVYVLTSCRTRT